MNMTELLRSPHGGNQIIANAGQEGNLDFGEFSRMPEYIAVNSSLVEILLPKLPANFVHVDVATGTGMVVKLLMEGAGKTDRAGKIIGVDPNLISLAIARENIHSSESVSIKFIEGMGQYLKELLKDEIPEEGVDSTSIHDALHEIRNNGDKAQVVQSMAGILKPGGFLSFNSAFTTVSNNDAQSKWGRWKLIAMRKLGMRGRNQDSDVMPILTPQNYKEIIENTGLVVVHEKITPVFLTKEALQAIARYPAFFRGTFDDILGQENVSDVDKSNALIQAMEELGVPSLPKIWYEIIAQKPNPVTTP